MEKQPVIFLLWITTKTKSKSIKNCRNQSLKASQIPKICAQPICISSMNFSNRPVTKVFPFSPGKKIIPIKASRSLFSSLSGDFIGLLGSMIEIQILARAFSPISDRFSSSKVPTFYFLKSFCTLKLTFFPMELYLG